MPQIIPSNYIEAVKLGYKIVDRKVQQIHHNNKAVYVSKSADINKAPVQIAGGRRKGQLFIWYNDGKGNGYSVRLYLAKIK